MTQKIENIRRIYQLDKIDRSRLLYSPIKQFYVWFNQVVDKILEPTAMILSTHGIGDTISSRVVLLKEVKRGCFVFYTNYNSLKGQEINSNPHVSLCFFWPEFEKQIRINGIATKTSDKVSSDYFKNRPRNSQISAWVSEQSSILQNRITLEEKFSYYESKFKNKTIPKPKYWGGYKVEPKSIEFWQGRKNRLHDRFIYVKKNNKWVIEMLSP